jgi:hypothetical protein
MDLRFFSKAVPFCFFLIIFFVGCATPIRVPIEPPPFPNEWMGAKWGGSPDEVKAALEKGGPNLFQEDTSKPPYALYASGVFLGEPAIFSYFFTPKSKRFFRIDVTYDNPGVYEKIKGELMQTFKGPTYSRKDVDHWSWNDNSLLILQREASFVQVSYSNGTFLRLNHQEGNGPQGR